ICNPGPQSDSFQENPTALIEVLSRATRRTDEGEKKDAYLSISSLSVYLVVEQEFPAVIAFRRTDEGFVRAVYEGLEAVIALPELKTELPLVEIYETVEFAPESPDNEDS